MIEQEVYRRMEGLIQGMLKASGSVSEALLQVLIQENNRHKEDKLYDEGIGETSLKNMLRGLQRNNDELMTLSVNDEDAKEFKEILGKTDIKNYVMIDLATDDRKIVLFAQSDIEEVKKALNVFSAERGLISEIDPESFFVAAKEQNISALEGIDEVDLELIRYNARKNPFVYTVVDSKDGITVLYKQEDLANMQKTLNNVAFSLSGEQGPLVREQIEIRLKGRKEVNIAVEEAEREVIIIDKQNPKNYVHVTADDFTYYKNNKEITRIPRTEPGAIEAVYQKIEGLTEPVVISKNEFELNYAERKALLESKTAVYPTGYSAMNEDIENLNTKEHDSAARAYAEKFGLFDVENDSNSLEAILTQVVERQSESNRNKEDKSIDDIQL